MRIALVFIVMERKRFDGQPLERNARNKELAAQPVIKARLSRLKTPQASFVLQTKTSCNRSLAEAESIYRRINGMISVGKA